MWILESNPEQGLEREESQVKEPQRPSSSTDERFQVSISGPQDQTAEIKTRGKHLVRKVLAAVCKTFDLDYDRCDCFYASLRMRRVLINICMFRSSLYVVTCSIDDDGVEERLRMCPPDWSIARCGITSTTELRIQLESHSASETVASHPAPRSV